MAKILSIILRRAGFLGIDEKIIKVKRWKPYVDRCWGHFVIAWPSYLMRTRSGNRITTTPLWTISTFRNLIFGVRR